MAAVYTTRFVGHKGLTPAAPTGFIVPPGQVAIVRNATAYCGGPVLGDEQVFLQLLEDGWTFAQWNVPTGNFSFYGTWEGRCVFNELEEFGFKSNLGTWDVSCSGYLFSSGAA